MTADCCRVVRGDGAAGGRRWGSLGRHLGLDVDALLTSKQTATVGTGAPENAGSDKRSLESVRAGLLRYANGIQEREVSLGTFPLPGTRYRTEGGAAEMTRIRR